MRERQEDIPLIAQYYINKYSAKYNRTPYKLTPDDKTILINYPWRGNVRELKNVIERAVLLSEGKKLEFNLSSNAEKMLNDIITDNPTLEELQRRYIRFTLDKTGGKLSGPGGAIEIL